jgi:hypothetical protein
LERSSLRVAEEKFAANLPIVFQNETVTIYAVPDSILNENIIPGS